MHLRPVMGLLCASAAAILALAASVGARPACAARPARPVARAIVRSMGYLVRHCRHDGCFVYRHSAAPGIRFLQGYNVVRHAGAIYALGLAEAWRPQPRLRTTMLRASAWMRENCIRSPGGRRRLLAVWTLPHVDLLLQPPEAELGGTGLGLVALASTERVAPQSVGTPALRRLGRFLLFMQKADGGFYTRYGPSPSGRSDRDPCLYYPGEAILGLVMLFEIDGDLAWLRAAARGLSFLARSRRSASEVPEDHWALVATARLWPHAARLGREVSPADLATHGRRICERILADRPGRASCPALEGSLTASGRICPTATRLEGLLAALSFLPERERSLRERIHGAVHGGIAFLLRAQIPSGPLAGGFPGGAPRPGADWTTKEVRIDFVQHALSALILYDRRFPSPGSGRGPSPSRR